MQSCMAAELSDIADVCRSGHNKSHRRFGSMLQTFQFHVAHTKDPLSITIYEVCTTWVFKQFFCLVRLVDIVFVFVCYVRWGLFVCAIRFVSSALQMKLFAFDLLQ